MPNRSAKQRNALKFSASNRRRRHETSSHHRRLVSPGEGGLARNPTAGEGRDRRRQSRRRGEIFLILQPPWQQNTMGVSRSNVIAPCRLRGRLGTKPRHPSSDATCGQSGRLGGKRDENEESEENRTLPSGTVFRSTGGTEGRGGRLNRFGGKNLNAA